jgi:RimJ/RimL family protein N-acetyltransferase
MPQPILHTGRLVLRPFTLADAADVQRLAGAREIADTTLHIPYPYTDGMAEAWISTHEPSFNNGASVTFAIVLQDGNVLCGAIGISIDYDNAHAELGYWLGVPYWGQGYGTEAAQALLRYGFQELGLHRIHANHFGRNPASGRVMQKIGMRYEGCLRQHARKWDAFEDIVQYGILRSEWQAQQT